MINGTGYPHLCLRLLWESEAKADYEEKNRWCVFRSFNGNKQPGTCIIVHVSILDGILFKTYQLNMKFRFILRSYINQELKWELLLWLKQKLYYFLGCPRSLSFLCVCLKIIKVICAHYKKFKYRIEIYKRSQSSHPTVTHPHHPSSFCSSGSQKVVHEA